MPDDAPRDPRDRRRGEGESIATMWARMISEVEAGEVVAITNKFGKEVAVMISKEKFDALVADIERLSKYEVG